MSRCRTLPLGVVTATECTPRSSSGWCTITRSASPAIASSATASTGSTASRMSRTSSSGSPQTSPTRSQSSAYRGGYQLSSRSMTSRSSMGQTYRRKLPEPCSECVLGARLVHLALEALPIGRPKLELLQLAGRGAGELVAELDGGRGLVAGDLGLAVLDQLVLGQRRARGLDHERLDRLAPLLVGDADDGDLGDVGMGEDDVLDLDRGDVLAAGDDHVLFAVLDGQIAIGSDEAAVAGVEPAALQASRGLLGLLPVALEDHVGAGQDLALAVHVEGDADRRLAGAHQVRGALLGGDLVPFAAGAVDGQQRRGLGEAVDLHELPAELLLDPHDRLGRRRGTGHDDPHLVAAGDLTLPGLCRVEYGGHDRRCRAHDGDAVLLDPAQD